ncbi:monocarboxylate transporter 12-like [Haemaphysalis longicornis]
MVFPDRIDGRWDIAIAASLAAFFGNATSRCSGWFYVAFMEYFGVDRQAASWPNSVLTIMFRSSGFFIAALQRCTSLFWIGILGSVLVWGGLIASVFAKDIAWLTVTMGLLHGQFRDVMGSYDNLYRIMAGLVFALAVTFIFLIHRQKKCDIVASHEAEEA